MKSKPGEAVDTDAVQNVQRVLPERVFSAGTTGNPRLLLAVLIFYLALKNPGLNGKE